MSLHNTNVIYHTEEVLQLMYPVAHYINSIFFIQKLTVCVFTLASPKTLTKCWLQPLN